MKTRMAPGLLSLLWVACVSAGCGYSSERPFRDDVQTIHVQMLQSKEFRRGLEFQLTEALVKRIEMDTPYKIADQRSADTMFSGEILEVRNRTFGQEFRTRRPRETGSTVVVAFRWKDQRSGEILSERQRFISTSSFIPPAGETFDTGMVRGLDRLAEEIVEAGIESPW